MAITLSVSIRNGRANAIESTTGTAPTLRIRTGAPPSNADAAASGSVLATMTLPSDWMGAASLGAVSKLGTWEDLSADAGGNAGHFEIVGSGGTIRGTITATGGGGDMELNNIVLAAGQPVSVTTFTLTDGNAGT